MALGPAKKKGVKLNLADYHLIKCLALLNHRHPAQVVGEKDKYTPYTKNSHEVLPQNTVLK